MMKTIDLKSLLIGFLSCLVIMLTLSFKPANISSEVGKYQAFSGTNGNYMINTATGATYTQGLVLTKFKWRKVSKETIFND